MSPKEAPISASEIGSYLYCQRSWGYQRQGMPSANVQELARGALAHDQHGRGMRRVRRLSASAFALIALALLLLAVQFFLA